MNNENKTSLTAFEKLRIVCLFAALAVYVILWQISKTAVEKDIGFTLLCILEFLIIATTLILEIINAVKAKKSRFYLCAVILVILFASIIFIFRIDYMGAQITTNQAYFDYMEKLPEIDTLTQEQAQALRDAYKQNRVDILTQSSQSFAINSIITLGVIGLLLAVAYFLFSFRKNNASVAEKNDAKASSLEAEPEAEVNQNNTDDKK